MVLQGYQPDVHFQALFQGMLAYCQNLPPLRWVPPPDQFEKSSTLILPPWSFTKQSNKLPTGPQPVPGPFSAAAKGKGRADQAIGPKEKAQKGSAPACPKITVKGKAATRRANHKPANEFGDNTTNDDYKGGDTSDGPNKVIQVKSRPVNKELVKCSNCEKDGSQCLINPSMAGKASPACYKCFMMKQKCSLYKRSLAEGRGQLEWQQ